MNIFRSYKRTRTFLWINIIGLAIGLATSIMLILFVVNELSYDKHFANSERIISLNTVIEDKDSENRYGINLRQAYTEIPEKVPGIEATVQIYKGRGTVEVIRKPDHFQDVKRLYADANFFKIFQMKFVEGTPQTALENVNSIVLTRRQANIIFGSASEAMGKTILVDEYQYTVSSVVEELPSNTHFSFDVLANMSSMPGVDYYGGLEYYTFYLIKADASLANVAASIEKEYTSITKSWGANFSRNVYGATEKLTDIYLHSKASSTLGKRNDMSFIWLLSGLALFILILAITNFINLFMAQGESRMNEIGIRKANGAKISNIVGQFFSEVSVIVFIAFVLGFFLAVVFTPLFSELIKKEIDLQQLLSPLFILSIVGLFIITVTLSAIYPSFYLSRFNPLDILGKRLKFSKRRLTVSVVVFQSVITIVLISFIFVINKQATYLENISIGYNPNNVMCIMGNNNILSNYDALKQELLTVPEVEMVSGADHLIGSGPSGDLIGLLDNTEKGYGINSYRVVTGFTEIMAIELREGEFYKENTPENISQIVVNESAIKLLGFEYPVVGKTVNYRGPTEIIGVVKDFYYGDLSSEIQPLVLSLETIPRYVYIKFNENVSRIKAQEVVLQAFRKFDPDFHINAIWSEDIYTQKFDNIKTQSSIVMIGSLLSVFIAVLGLVATHLYATIRRTKEIGIRRINGASPQEIFTLLSSNIMKWIAIAGIIAIPLVYYISSEWLNNFTNRTSLNWMVFVLPILIQCIIALVVTGGVSLRALARNPVEALKSE